MIVMDKVSMLRKILQVVNIKCTSVKYKYIENAKYRMYKYKMTAMNKVSVLRKILVLVDIKCKI